MTNEIVLYKPNDQLSLEVKLENETVWLSQQQMVILFDSTKQNISLHINNIFKEGELNKEATVKEYLTVQALYKKVISSFCILLFQKSIVYFPKSDIFYEILGNYLSKIADISPNLKNSAAFWEIMRLLGKFFEAMGCVESQTKGLYFYIIVQWLIPKFLSKKTTR